MIRVQVKNNKNGKGYGGIFDTQAEADTWIAEQKAKNSWGLPERELPLQEGASIPVEALSSRQEEVSPSVMESRQKLDAEGNGMVETVLVNETTVDPDTGEEVVTQVTKEVPVMEDVVVREAQMQTYYTMPCEYEITVKEVTTTLTGEQCWAKMREDRDAALAATDFTQLADAPIDSTTRVHYRDYRVYLRDLTTRYTDDNITSYKIMTFEEWKAFKKIF